MGRSWLKKLNFGAQFHIAPVAGLSVLLPCSKNGLKTTQTPDEKKQVGVPRKQILSPLEAFSKNGTEQPWDGLPGNNINFTGNIFNAERPYIIMILGVFCGAMSIPPISHLHPQKRHFM